MTGVTFIQALQNMAAIYTLPKILISDQGTNFVGANEILSTINKTTEVKQMCASKGIEWKFTPARAPWFGGVYERLIGLVKRELHKMCRVGLPTNTPCSLTTRYHKIPNKW